MIKKHEEKEGNSERWLLTYSDLITLLMIFFVIMYAMSNVSTVKYKKLGDSLSLAFGEGKSIIGNEDGISIEEKSQPIDPNIVEQQKLEEVKAQVDKYLNENGIAQNVTTKIEDKGLVISLKDAIFFESGHAEIRKENEQKLRQIGNILAKMDNYIRIEGNTDNIPISNKTYKSNWHLSSERAINVVEFFIKECKFQPEKLSAVGYGEYRPIGDNNTEAGKIANRRVDIVIINSKYNHTEEQKSKTSTNTK